MGSICGVVSGLMPRGIVLVAIAGMILGNVDQADQKKGSTREQAAATKYTPSATGNPSAPEEYKPVCDHPKDGNEASICASLSQAASAVVQASAANTANVISSSALHWNELGIIVVVFTFGATAWAAFAASSASRAAAKSVDAYMAGERGILLPQPVSAKQGVTITLKNVGKSPVTIIRADAGAFGEPPSGPLNFFISGAGYSDVVITSGASFEFPWVLQPYLRAEHVCVCGGVISEDLFGRITVTGLAIKFEPGGNISALSVDLYQWEAEAERLRRVYRKRRKK